MTYVPFTSFNSNQKIVVSLNQIRKLEPCEDHVNLIDRYGFRTSVKETVSEILVLCTEAENRENLRIINAKTQRK